MKFFYKNSTLYELSRLVSEAENVTSWYLSTMLGICTCSEVIFSAIFSAIETNNTNYITILSPRIIPIDFGLSLRTSILPMKNCLVCLYEEAKYCLVCLCEKEALTMQWK